MTTISTIPNRFTNQTLINAFFAAAQTLGVVGDELMQKAGLDVHALAADAHTREAGYTGAPLDKLPGLSPSERALVAQQLLQEWRNMPLWRGQVNAPAGLNLRTAPTETDSTVIQSLTNGTPLDVLHEQDNWLFVAVSGETAGFVAANFVGRQTTTRPSPHNGQPSTPPPPMAHTAPHFRADPTVQQVSLAPAESNRIVLNSAAGQGAQRLATIWNRYGGLLALLAERLQIDPAEAIAVLTVESGGQGFAADGRMMIRFENHLFYQEWGERHQAEFFRYFDFNRSDNRSWLQHRWRPNEQSPFLTMHSGDPQTQALEWRVLDFAASLDDTVAKRSISMGAPQILGRNHARIGYATVQAMFDAFTDDERNQIIGLFDFIQSDGALVTALHRHDYVAFARGYNGSGQADHYGALIHQVASSADTLLAAPALTPFDPTAPAEPPLSAETDEMIAFLPIPELPERFVSVVDGSGNTGHVDSGSGDNAENRNSTTGSEIAQREAEIRLRVLAAWADHMEDGLQNNTLMFGHLLKAFMRPYYMTIVMYGLLFLLGIGLFIAAVYTGSEEATVATWFFGGLGVVTFLTFFISRPLAALEENLIIITRLGVIYNSYWTRLLYMQDNETIQADLEDATNDAIAELDKLTDKSTQLAENRPGLGVR